MIKIKQVLLFSFLFCCFTTVCMGAKKPAILFLGNPTHATPKALRSWDDWVTSGYQLNINKVSDIKNLKNLKPFNTVVINFLPFVDSKKNVTAGQIQFEKVLKQYLEQGGGVVIFCGGGQYGRMKPALDHLLKPYGAMVPEEQIVDKTNIMGYVFEGKLIANYTTQITPAPMTRGIKKIGYLGQASRADVMKLMMPIVIKDKKAWNIVLRGEKQAYSAAGKRPSYGPEIKDTPDTYSEYPVMAAWRNVGKGRMFLFPQNACHTVTSPDVFNNFFWTKGDTRRADRPDNRTFIMQTVDWAAQPSIKSGIFGGFKTNPKLSPSASARLKSGEHAKNFPIKWAKIKAAEKLGKPFGEIKGLIGAQSRFSGGKYTVKQLADAARKSGMDFIVFTEKLEKLNKNKWKQLQQQCRKISNDKFIAIPGLWALDKVGNRHFAIGEAQFPTPTAVTKDGKRLDNLSQFWFRIYGARMTGFANVNKNPNPWFEMKKVSGMALYTYENNKLVDDALTAYCESSYNMENYVPYSVSIMTTPEQVAAASKNMLNVFSGHTLKGLRDYINGKNKYKRRLFWETLHFWNLSKGPRLDYHNQYNINNLAVDEELENIYRYGFKFSNLKAGDEILLMDGPKVFRKWIAKKSTFSIDKTWPHDQVRVFILKVIRNKETIFVSSPLTHKYGRRFFSCGDRQNSLPFNYQPDKKGHWYVSGVPISAHLKGWEPSTLIYAPVSIYLIAAMGIEVVPSYASSWKTAPDIPFKSSRKEGGRSLSSTHFHRLSCPGLYIVDDIAKRIYPNGGRHDRDQSPPKFTEPLQFFNYTARLYALYGMLGQANGQLAESKITALKNVSMRSGATEAFVSIKRHPHVPNNNVTHYVEKEVGGKKLQFNLKEKNIDRIFEKLSKGDYIGYYPSGLNHGGASYVVSGKLKSDLRFKNNRVISCLKLDIPSVWKKGQTFDYSLIFTTGGSTPTRKQSDYKNIKNFLGFNGLHPSIQGLKGGRLLSQPGIATIKVPNHKSVVSFKTPKNAKDPIGLTVRLKGYNPNWLIAYRLNNSKKWRYMGELDGFYYFNLYTNVRANSVIAGHPILADNPNAIITLNDPKGTQSAFEIYNKSNKPISVEISTNPSFFGKWEKVVNLKAYESKNITVTSKAVY